MDYLVCIPVYKMTDRVRKCFETLDISRENILVISGDIMCKELEDRARVIVTDENIGVSRAWNLGIRENRDWTFLVSSSMVYPQGFSKVVEVLEQSGEQEVFFTQHSYHCNAVSKKCIDKIGYFDENFYPAYFEDADLDYRMNLAGINWKRVYTIPAECQADGAATLDGLRLNFDALQDYFVSKWGGKPGECRFKVPFNDPHYDIKFWSHNSIAKLKERYNLK